MIRFVNTILSVAFGVLALFGPSARCEEANPHPQPATGSFDHIRILVHDVSASRIAYRDRLGFVFPDAKPYVYSEGSVHDISDMRDGTYLELVGITNRAELERVRPWIVKFLDAGEGAHSIGLVVPSANGISDRLRSRGIDAPIFKLARVNPQDPPVLLVTPKMPHLPDGAIFFLEYPPKKAEGGPKTVPPQQTNTTEQILAVWIVVKNLAKSTADMEALGFHQARSLRSAMLGSEAREFAAARGRIVLLRATGNGPVARFAKVRGEGVMGFTLAAADVERARALIERSASRLLNTYDGWYGRSVLIPADLAMGAWIEMVQK
jgi:Glyoxalase-like domain